MEAQVRFSRDSSRNFKGTRTSHELFVDWRLLSTQLQLVFKMYLVFATEQLLSGQVSIESTSLISNDLPLDHK